MTLLRAGLSRRVVQSPSFPAYSVGTTFTYLAPIHALSRLLAVEQYVLLADGKQSGALDSLETALRLTDAITALGPYGALTVVNGQKRATDVVANHLDQLSARSCERLTRLVSTRLAAPNASAITFEAERDALTRDFVDALRRSVEAFSANVAASNLNVGAGDEEDNTGSNAGDAFTDAEGEAVMRKFALLKRDDAARSAVADEIEARINAAMSNAVADLHDPSRTAPFFSVPALRRERFYCGFGWAFSLVASYGKTVRAHQVARTRLQLLGVHAALRRYRWETGRAPESLETLGLKSGLERDPFTGGPLTYARDADEWSFTLSSAGSLPRDRYGNIVSKGKRTPVEITP